VKNQQETVGESSQRSVVADKLLAWYDTCGRELSWRRDTTLYTVWVSEIMLQQTRVEAVEPYFKRFISRFPDMRTLADATEEDVLHAWQGLGYYSRARNLQTGIREALERYGGALPQTRQEVESLTGVGSYTAGALLSIVHGQAEPAVDGNVLRVFSRLFCLKELITSSVGKRTVATLVREVIPADRPGDFNQAIMDLGSAVGGRTPRCLNCPLADECMAYKEGCQSELPRKAKKAEPRPVNVAVGIVKNHCQQFFVRKRPKGGLLAGMWEFPTVEALNGEQVATLRSLFANSGQAIDSLIRWRSLKHVFSHRAWDLQIYQGLGTGKDHERHEDGCWMTLNELAAVPLGKPHQIMANWLAEEGGASVLVR
jgi:A/G-specific adenine glycosylase